MTTLRASAGRAATRQFQAPLLSSSLFQVANSGVGFIASLAVIHALTNSVSPLGVLLTPIAAGFLVRIFIIQHDCGHGAFFRSKRANDIMGFACSLVTMVPYASWRRQHAGHHGVWNDLDRRDRGVDIYSTCLTVAEYSALSSKSKFWHRVSRHPLITHLLLPPLVFLVLYRLPFDMPKNWKRERRALVLTNLALIAVYGGLGLLLGFEQLIIVTIPTITITAIIGIWLFSVQHRFDGAQWARDNKWNATYVALYGSSYLHLPRILQWFTGNIGLHHVHHLNPRIPNYQLESCHEAIPMCREARVLTLWQALRAPAYILWDEDRQVMVTLNTAKECLQKNRKPLKRRTEACEAASFAGRWPKTDGIK